jgi:hypothetical protein
MYHVEFSSNEQAPAQVCATCGQTLPLENPCTNEQCPVKVAAEMRTAASQSSFRLGC